MNTLKISLNGNIRNVREGTTILKFLKEEGMEELKVVIQISGQILGRGRYSKRKLKEGDRVEIISFVGGG